MTPPSPNHPAYTRGRLHPFYNLLKERIQRYNDWTCDKTLSEYTTFLSCFSSIFYCFDCYDKRNSKTFLSPTPPEIIIMMGTCAGTSAFSKRSISWFLPIFACIYLVVSGSENKRFRSHAHYNVLYTYQLLVLACCFMSVPSIIERQIQNSRWCTCFDSCVASRGDKSHAIRSWGGLCIDWN